MFHATFVEENSEFQARLVHEQVDEITAEGTRQKGIVVAAGTEQVLAVNNVGAVQVHSVENAGAEQVDAVTAEGNAQKSAITTYCEGQQTAIDLKVSAAKSHAEQTGEDRIATGEDRVATGADRSAVNTALLGFAETTLPDAIQAVEDKADTEIARVGQASDTQVQAVNAAGAEQIGLATAQADRAEVAAEGAEGSAGAAAASAGAAHTSEVNAATSETQARQSKTAAQQAQQECAADKIAAEAAKAEAEKAQAAIGANGANMFASPIWQKASGASVSVTPAAGSNFEVQLNGATIQPGTGDPSPTNIRPIYGVGQFDKKGEFTTTGWAKSGSDFYKESSILDKGISSPLLSHSLPYVGTFDTTAAFSAAAASFTFAIGSGASNNIRGRIYIKAPCATVEELSNWLQTINSAVYYQSTSYPTATQVYCGLSITDANGYHGYAAGPMAPLYDGDTLDFVSGEVTRNSAKETFSGKESVKLSSGSIRVALTKGYPKRNLAGQCSHFPSVYSFDGDGCFAYPYENGIFVLGVSAVSKYGYTVDSFKEFLANQESAGTPVVFRYELATPTTEIVAISEPIPLPPGQSDKYNPQPTVIAAADGTVTVGYNMDGTAAYNTIKTAIAALGGT